MTRVLYVMLAVATAWCITAAADVNITCHEVVSRITAVSKYKNKPYKYYYSTGFLNWSRRSAYKNRVVLYYVHITVNSTREIDCPVDGGWGPWKYGECSLTCGNGTFVRTRKCDNPTPAYRGKNCEGPSREVLSCYEGCCPVHGGWSSWRQGSCSKSCGGGIVQFTRTCSKPTPSCGGSSCRGISVHEEACNEFCCRTHGGWSSWRQSSCSKTCGGGILKFTRTCSNPTPSCGGSSCRGISVVEEACNEFCCRVDGGWSSWYNQSDCSKSCGGGVLIQRRNCSQPSPSCRGRNCQGENVKVIPCNTQCCPVHGGWSNWSIGNCSELCDGGIKNRTRSCNNPVPSCGGINCVGEAVETVECNTLPCIGAWSNWSDCSVTCGNGIQFRNRTCVTDCENGTVEYKECYVDCCSGTWSNWSNCSVTCGNGTMFRNKTCFKDYENETAEFKECYMGCCPVNGGWSDWSIGSCSVTCGGGVRVKFRGCNNPMPSCGGQMCSGSIVALEKCNRFLCT